MSNYTEVQIAPWNYVCTEPVVVMARETETNTAIETRKFKALSAAMAHFATFHVRPIEGRRAAIVDRYLRIVLGYEAPSEHDVHWFGTQLGFDLLEVFCDRASVVLWAAGCRGDLNREVKDAIP